MNVTTINTAKINQLLRLRNVGLNELIAIESIYKIYYTVYPLVFNTKRDL